MLPLVHTTANATETRGNAAASGPNSASNSGRAAARMNVLRKEEWITWLAWSVLHLLPFLGKGSEEYSS
jgi:hypothetical protein